MANMDGTNQTTLFTNQKGPVGEHAAKLLPKMQNISVYFQSENNKHITKRIPPEKHHYFHSGLSIDYEKEQLYWISSGDSTINRCQLDGTKLEILEGVKGKLVKASALAIMGNVKEKKKDT